MPSSKPTLGVNDLQSQFPDIAAEAYGWDPTTVTKGTNQKKDWKCKEGHLYSSLVSSRTSIGSGCPFCSNNQVLAGFNDLQTKFPDIAAEAFGWDPSTVVAGTDQKKDWKCKEGHNYSSAVKSRTSSGRGCAICAGKKVLAGFNDLQTKFPDIAAEAYGWDPELVTAGSAKKQEWKCRKGHIYSSVINTRTKNRTGCPICSNNQVLAGFNDLKTKFPDIAAEAYGWDPSSVVAGTPQKKDWKCKEGHIYHSTISGRTYGGNGCAVCSGQQVLKGFNDLKTKFPDIAAEAYEWDPTTVVAGTPKKKDWRCKEGHIYSSSVGDRTRSDGKASGCPVCSGRQVLAGFNDLQTKYPDIAAEAYGWDPAAVTAGSGKKQDWKCKEGHIYPSTINTRTSRGSGCPICSGQQVLAGFNDLQTKFPDISAEAYGWDPSTVTKGSDIKKEWKCKEGHIYSSVISSRTSRGSGCPICSGQQVLKGFNDLKTKFPDIAAEAYEWDPTTVVAGTLQKKDWRCKEGHLYSSLVSGRTRSDGKASGCPVCSGQQVLKGFNDLQTKYPDIAAEAYGWFPSSVVAGTGQKKEWKCKEGHIYSSAVNSRTSHGCGCPICSGQQVLKGFNDLKTKYPDIAAEAYEWDPTTVVAGTPKKKDWRCKEGHIYSSLVSSRTSNGSGCPVCAEYGFDPEKDAWFYLMERPGEQQLGISNVITDRLRTHESNGWSLIEHTSVPARGKTVLDTETALKRWLKTDVGLIKGTTENWSTTKMEVQSLAELKERSGIETDLF